MKFLIAMLLCCVAVSLPSCKRDAPTIASKDVSFYRLRAPNNAYDLEQVSGLHYGEIGQRKGLWLVCDRNGGASTNHVYFISDQTLSTCVHAGTIIVDEAFPIVAPSEGWRRFAQQRPNLNHNAFIECMQQTTQNSGSPPLDLEAITIINRDTPRILVAAESPFSTIIELAIESTAVGDVARIVNAHHYAEAATHAGTARNDGIEGLACGDGTNTLYFVEEGTIAHDGASASRMFFLDPILGHAVLQDNCLVINNPTSTTLTQAVRGQRQGQMQTLNALTRTNDGLLAVDRNGGWILRITTANNTAERWINLYDFKGTNLREALADFPGSRRMPYISIEGITEGQGYLWLVDDPAIPESFRASALIRLTE